MSEDLDRCIQEAIQDNDVTELTQLLDQMQFTGYPAVLHKMNNDDLYDRCNEEFQGYLSGECSIEGFMDCIMEIKRRKLKLKAVEPNEYSGSIIYKFTSDRDPTLFYIGSSTLKGKERAQKHEQRGRTILKTTAKLYLKMKEGHKFIMETLEVCDLNSRKQLQKKEQEYINKLKPTLNNKKASLLQ